MWSDPRDAAHVHEMMARIAEIESLVAHEYRRIDQAELSRLSLTHIPELKSALPPLPPPSEIF